MLAFLFGLMAGAVGLRAWQWAVDRFDAAWFDLEDLE